MTAVGGLVLVLGLLVSARCEVRARDPEVEEDEERGRGGGGGGGGGRGGGGGVEGFPPHPDRLHPGATQTAPLGERGNYPARTGNWCAFVQRRVVTQAVVCGSEKYVMKSQSPCPSGAPDCQLPMYKLSSRPLYRQKQQIYSALLWHCCPGHSGRNCEDTASDTQLDSASSDLIGGSGPVRTELHVPGVQRLHQRDDPNREQNDHQAPYDTGDPDSPHTTLPPALHRDRSHHHTALTHHTPPPALHRDHGRHHTPPPALHRDHGRDHTAPVHHTPPPALHRDHGRHHTPPPALHQDHGRHHTAPVHHTPPPALHRDHGRHHTAHAAGSPHDHQHNLHHGEQELHRPDTATLPDDPAAVTIPYPDYPTGDPDADALPYPDVPAALPVPHMMALVMSQLQPVLQGFNRSLEHLSRQVGELARDVAELKSSRLEAEPQSSHPVLPDLAEAADERLDARLEEAFEHVREVQRELESQRRDMEIRLHSQHAMLHYNLTSFKTDIDMKLKRHQKMLQVSLQAMNATLMELNQNQDQDQDQDKTVEELGPRLLPPQPSDTAALWEAVERLDNMVINNTVKVEGLSEDAEVTAGGVQQLRQDIKSLEKLINVTARTSQVQFMETGLEVEAARETVLRRVGELAGNLSLYGERLAETDKDVDDLYDAFNSHNSSTGCDCVALWAAVAMLERGVANVTQLANENTAALEDGEGGAGHWAGGGDWETAVGALQHDLQQVRESVASVASVQSSSQSLDQCLTQLNRSLTAALADVSALTEADRKQRDRKQRDEMQRLSASFDSLLMDAVRHSDVLEILLGEEVLEFLEWPVQDQEAHSIPALKETLRGHEQSIAALLDRNTGDREELPSADQAPPSSSLLSDGWRPDGGAARERQRLLQPADGGDLWNLEKTVEELKIKVLQLEETMPSGEDQAALHAEVTWLKRGLEEHLRTFKNVFSNADVLASSDATLELDKLWQLLQSRDGKKEKKKKGGNHRSRRETTGVAPVQSSQSGASVLLAAEGDAQRRRRGWN
ncbi:multimerin-2 isoform X3 [Sander lucioperca]|uniref:multimerin-2 isoform X3 n=1 Tax=Sander lucioperca TaxID=283035 RepID=UPI00165359B0|nr:multimerin-2 isoform X3 [Sander lucioperca]